MWSQFRPAIVILLLLTLVTGVIYPAAITVIAGVAFHNKSTGSVLTVGDKAVGSSLLAQPFSERKYFWPRPSSTSPFPAKSDVGSGSNLASTNPGLAEKVAQRLAELRAADPGNTAAVPVELVTASGSGLDPHISPEAAEYQAGRVAVARGVTLEQIRQAIVRHTEGRTLGLLGEARVNVLELNLDLDSRLPVSSEGSGSTSASSAPSKP